MTVSFDLFGTLVAAERPSDPAAVVARELGERGVAVPGDWSNAYRDAHVDLGPGEEYPLTDHVRDALASRDVEAADSTVETAVTAAFDRPVATREDATAAVAAAADRGPVGILSNCSVPGLVERTIERSELDAGAFDAVVASVDVGWRKPDRRAFEAVASALGVAVADLVHVGDDPAADGGAAEVGATSVPVSDVPLADLPAHLEAMPCR